MTEKLPNPKTEWPAGSAVPTDAGLTDAASTKAQPGEDKGR